MYNKLELTNDELRVVRILEDLEVRQRLTASQIMERLMIKKDLRYFHQIVYNLRLKGVPVVSSKSSGHSGYWLARSRDEIDNYLRKKELYLDTHKKLITAMKDAATTIF